MRRDGGLKRFQQRLRAIPDAIKEDVKPSLVKSAEEMATAMKALAPVDDGDLRDSIQVTEPGQRTPQFSQPGGATMVPENAAVVSVGNTDVRYPHLVEYGTTLAQAQPFFWPVVRSLNKRTTNRIKRAISKSVRDNWGS